MPRNSKKQTTILSEMTGIICKHLSKLPVDERNTRIEAFEKVVNRGGNRVPASLRLV